MRSRPLGRTGLVVSAVSLGTVSLGVDYGIAAPGEYGRPDDASAIALLRAAVERGITLVDTAPAYGDSERLVGEALGTEPRALIATKVNPEHTGESRDAILASLDASRSRLRRDTLDIVQIHNATPEMLARGVVVDALADAQRRGVVRVLGASVYGEEAALAVIRSGRFGMLQVALSALDQRMMREVLPAAAAAGVGVLVRSAFLKGALTPKAQWLPDGLAPLRDAASRAKDLLARGRWDALPEAAMRFCLSVPHVSSVLTGARTEPELMDALAAEAAGPLDDRTMTAAAGLAVDDERLVNPVHWPAG